MTFVATTLFVPYELYELAGKITVIRVGAFAVNLAILLYLLLAKRLFGFRGGPKQTGPFGRLTRVGRRSSG